MNILGDISYKILILFIVGMALFFVLGFSLNQELDEKVRSFLESHRYQWRDMNVPRTDGQILYDIVVENGYTRALEIGTSTGHSGTWIAWALSKTGGKLITIEHYKNLLF